MNKKTLIALIMSIFIGILLSILVPKIARLREVRRSFSHTLKLVNKEKARYKASKTRRSFRHKSLLLVGMDMFQKPIKVEKQVVEGFFDKEYGYSWLNQKGETYFVRRIGHLDPKDSMSNVYYYLVFKGTAEAIDQFENDKYIFARGFVKEEAHDGKKHLKVFQVEVSLKEF